MITENVQKGRVVCIDSTFATRTEKTMMSSAEETGVDGWAMQRMFTDEIV